MKYAYHVIHSQHSFHENENRLIGLAVEIPKPAEVPSNEAPNDQPVSNPIISNDEREQRKNEREYAEQEDKKNEASSFNALERELAPHDREGQKNEKLLKVKAFISGARETLSNEMSKEIFDEAIRALSHDEHVALYNQMNAASTAVDSTITHNIDEETATHINQQVFARIVLGSAMKMKLHELPPQLQMTVDTAAARMKLMLSDEESELCAKAHGKMRAAIQSYLDRPDNTMVKAYYEELRVASEKKLNEFIDSTDQWAPGFLKTREQLVQETDTVIHDELTQSNGHFQKKGISCSLQEVRQESKEKKFIFTIKAGSQAVTLKEKINPILRDARMLEQGEQDNRSLVITEINSLDAERILGQLRWEISRLENEEQGEEVKDDTH